MVSAPKRVTLSAFVQSATFPSLVKVRSFAVKKSLLSNDTEKTVSLRLTFGGRDGLDYPTRGPDQNRAYRGADCRGSD
jgi:hypothetical protein